MSITMTLPAGQAATTAAACIAMGDAARDSRDWPAAARHYGRALEIDPTLDGIWVQHGHARKEQGDLAGGEESYRRALALMPHAGDTHLQLGHVLKLQGRRQPAAEAYLHALLDPDTAAHARRELLDSLGVPAAILAEAESTGVVPDWLPRRPPVAARNRLADKWVRHPRNWQSFSGEPMADGGEGHRLLFSRTVPLPAGPLGFHIDIQSVGQPRPTTLQLTVHDGETLHQARPLREQPHPGPFEFDVVLPRKSRGTFELHGALPADALIRHVEISWTRPGETPLPPVFDLTLASPPLRQINNLIIGTTGVCNASCIHCPTNKRRASAEWSTDMPIGLFNSLVDQILEAGISIEGHVSLGLFGDGLLDRRVEQRARRMAEAFPDVPLHLNTNGAAYDRQRHRRLAAFVTNLSVHVETLEAVRYDRLMQPLRLANVLPRIHQMLEDMGDIVTITCPAHADNLDDLRPLRDYFTARGAAQTWFSPTSNRCSLDGVYAGLSLAPTSGVCRQDLLYDLIVDWDGTVLLCCNDFLRQEPIGNLSLSTLAEILEGPARRRAFEMLRDGRWGELATCRSCKFDCGHKVREIVEARMGAA